MSDSLIYYQCPSCSKKYQSGSEKAGSSINCPSCHYSFPIPSKSTFSVSDYQQQTIPERYPNLKRYLSIASFFTCVSVSLGCVAGLIFMTMNVMVGILIIVACIMYFIVMFAFIELVKVLLDIEESVRHLRKNG